MVINYIHNRFLGPEGGTQLLHLTWGRIDSTGDWKSMFLLGMQRHISAKINAENNNNVNFSQYETLMDSVNHDLAKGYENSDLKMFG